MPDVGDSVPVPTDRSRGGVFAGFQGIRRSEYWRVVGTSTHLLVLFDARTLARARQDPNARMRLLNFLGDYESLVAPFMARALPHWENHARIPVLMTDTTVSRAHGFAYPGTDVVLGCLGRLANGGAIWLDGSALFRFATARQAGLLSTAAHESAHLADFGLRLSPSREHHWQGWTIEGYAEAIRHMWAAQDLPAPFTGNLTSSAFGRTTASGARYRSYCGLESDRAKLEAMPETLDYGMACRMVSALIARAVLQGRPLEQVLERFSSLPERQSFTQVSNALTGTVRPPNEVVGRMAALLVCRRTPRHQPGDPGSDVEPAPVLPGLHPGGRPGLCRRWASPSCSWRNWTPDTSRSPPPDRPGWAILLATAHRLPAGRSDLAILRVR